MTNTVPEYSANWVKRNTNGALRQRFLSVFSNRSVSLGVFFLLICLFHEVDKGAVIGGIENVDHGLAVFANRGDLGQHIK